MNPERWAQIDQLFHDALGRKPEERAAFLDDVCVGDEALREQVQALLTAHQEAGSFIDRPAMEVEARGVAKDQGGAGADLPTGELISHYRIIAPLGAGGMGQVYLAQDMTLGRKVALKLLPLDFTRNTDSVRRFQQEARAASSLNHPNIITIHEIGQAEDRQFIATEYIDGLTLREYLAEAQSRPAAGSNTRGVELTETLSITTQIADALSAAHAKGIVHRDIKPENIMIVRDRHLMERESFVKVLDFGIAKLNEPLTSGSGAEATTKVLLNTHEGSVIGTASYMSPEQARGETVDARTDVWSLGVVIYELLSHRLPFGGDTTQDVIASILKDEPPPLSLDVPDRLRWIVEKALRRNREDRYQTAREMFSDLRELQKQRGHTIEAPTNLTSEEARRTNSSAQYFLIELKRRPMAAILVLTAVLMAVAGIAFGLYKFSQRQSQTIKPGAAVPFQRMKIARLTSTGKAIDAAISPDGKYVVHVVDDGQQQSLWMRQVSTSSNVQINPPANVSYLGLTFSPAGDYLYYIAWDHIAPITLYQMPVLGGGPRKLVTDIDSVVTFSPDGKQFAFLRGYPSKGELAVLVANADGTSERRLATHVIDPYALGDPAWSPDGKVIVYPAQSTDGNGKTLFEVQVADGSVKPIGSQRWRGVENVTWLRNGSGLMFIARESVASPSQIWYLSYPRGGAHRITNDLNDYLSMSLAADSAALLTVKSEQVSNIWIAPSDDARRASQVTDTKFDGVEGISWTPDDKIVYASGASGNLDLWLINADGTGRKQLTADAGNNSRPSVSSDGRYVAFMSDRTGANHIWRVDIDGSNARQLTNGDGELNPQCSPTDQWVLYQLTSATGGLGRVAIDGGEAVRIIDKNSIGAAISADGKWIAAGYFQPTVVKTAIYPIEGGEPHRFLDLSGYNYFRWTPDGRALAYVDPKNPSNIMSQPLDGGPPKRVTDFTSERTFSFAWSRDGKQLAVARGTVTNDVVLISNFTDQR